MLLYAAMALVLVPTASTSIAPVSDTTLPAVAAVTNVEPRIARLEQELAEAKTQSTEAHTAIADLRQDYSRARWAVGVVAFVLTLIGAVGYISVKERLKKRVENRIDTEVAARFDKMVPERILELEKRAEAELIRVAQILALNSQGAHDAALAAFGWDGTVTSLRVVTPGIRRAVIDSLYEAQTERQLRRTIAWTAVKELVEGDDSVESLRLFFRLSLSSKRYTDGLEHYRKIANSLQDPEAGRMVSAILRHSGNQKEALDLATRFKDKTLGSAVTIASLQRDLGEFGSAYDILRPIVEKLTGSSDPKPPEGWHRVLNTYIAICLDRNKAADGVAAAQFVLRQSSRPVEIGTVGRLVLALDSQHPARDDLLARFRSAVEALPLGQEAATMARVTLHRIDRRAPEAIDLLRRDIARVEGSNVPRSSDLYYLRSMLGLLLCGEERLPEAIDVLFPAATLNLGGEAKFCMALAKAKQSQGSEAARWLREAAREQPRWAILARDVREFATHPEVLEFLREFALPHAGATYVS